MAADTPNKTERSRRERTRLRHCAGVGSSSIDWLRRLEPLALVLLVTLHDVTAAGRGRDVLLALEVPIDPVVVDAHPTVVLEGLEVASNTVAVRHEESVLVVEEDVARDAIPDDPRGAALNDLNAPADPGPLIHHDIPRVLRLHVADHPDVMGSEGGRPLYLDRSLHKRAIQIARGALRDL